MTAQQSESSAVRKQPTASLVLVLDKTEALRASAKLITKNIAGWEQPCNLVMTSELPRHVWPSRQHPARQCSTRGVQPPQAPRHCLSCSALYANTSPLVESTPLSVSHTSPHSLDDLRAVPVAHLCIVVTHPAGHVHLLIVGCTLEAHRQPQLRGEGLAPGLAQPGGDVVVQGVCSVQQVLQDRRVELQPG